MRFPSLKILRRSGEWYHAKPNMSRCAPFETQDEFYRYVAALGRWVTDPDPELQKYGDVQGVVLVFGSTGISAADYKHQQELEAIQAVMKSISARLRLIAYEHLDAEIDELAEELNATACNVLRGTTGDSGDETLTKPPAGA